jgi:hypothetical protein
MLTIKVLEGSYPISLISTPESPLLPPQVQILTTNGQVIFSNISLNGTGPYSFIAYSPNMTSGFSPIFTLSSITIKYSFSPHKVIYT